MKSVLCRGKKEHPAGLKPPIGVHFIKQVQGDRDWKFIINHFTPYQITSSQKYRYL